MFAGARIAPDMIWLSRLPTEPLSAPVMRMWYGPPLIVARAEARPPAARPEARGEVPAEEEHHLRRCCRNGVRDRDVRDESLFRRRRRACTGHAGDRAAVHRRAPDPKLVRIVKPPPLGRSHGRVSRDRERALRAADAVRAGEALAAVRRRLRVVPGRQRVVRVMAALAGQPADLDRASGQGPFAGSSRTARCGVTSSSA